MSQPPALAFSFFLLVQIWKATRQRLVSMREGGVGASPKRWSDLMLDASKILSDYVLESWIP